MPRSHFVRTINEALQFIFPTQPDSPAPESHEGRLARLNELEAVIDESWLAPPRGSTVVYPEPHGRAVKERPAESVRQRLAEKYPIERCCLNSWYQLVWVGKVCELLQEPITECGVSDIDTERLDRSIVGSILNLWRSVIIGRIFLNVWGDELIACREMRSYRCPLGVYPSATRAVQALAEEVLAELWDTAWESDPPPGPPYDKDIRFAAGCDLPRFRVDWWYGTLLALRQRFRALPSHWGLEEESGGPTCWEAGLQQEQAALRQLPSPQVDSKTRKTAKQARPGRRAPNDNLLDFDETQRKKNPGISDKEILEAFRKKNKNHPIFESDDPRAALRAARSRRKRKPPKT